MEADLLLKIILGFLVFGFALERWLNWLNNKIIKTQLPEEVVGIYKPEEYQKMLRYEKVTDQFSSLVGTLSFGVSFYLLSIGFFGWFDGLIRYAYGSHPIVNGLLFFGILGFVSDILTTPFAVYSTFVIEQKFGFNKTTVKTFITDKLKGWLVGALMGGLIYSLIVWLFLNFGENFWVYAWVFISLFSILMSMFYASWILPLFNKLTPLPEGELKSKIEGFCIKIKYPLTELFVMDGSKRSTKANAFFTGLGKKKKIVLFDTLIEKLTEEEVEAVLAHEVGHYKKKHILQSTITSIITTGIYLFVFAQFLNSPLLAEALGTSIPSFHISILAFGLLFSPISTIIGLVGNMVSRKNEFEADAFAKEFSNGEALKSGLKKLAVDSLSNLTPHPFYVFFNYSHPPLLKRLKALE